MHSGACYDENSSPVIATLSHILNNFIGGLVVFYKDETTSGQVCSQSVQGFYSQMNIAKFRHFTDQFLFFIDPGCTELNSVYLPETISILDHLGKESIIYTT